MPYIEALKNYAVFDGRAGRGEFWWFMLVHVAVALVMGFIDNGVFPTLPLEQRPIMSVYLAVTLSPSLAVAARRLRDAGASVWILLAFYVPWVVTAILAPWVEQASLIGLLVSAVGFAVMAAFAARGSRADG